jgi:hypothetical protein
MTFWRTIAIAGALLAATATAAAAATYKVGDRVAVPTGFNDKYYDSVVVAVDPSRPYPFRVHPLGFLDTMDSSYSAAMIRPRGSVTLMPVGGIKNDPWLMKITGAKAFHPTALYAGKYECWTLSGGGSASLEAAAILNFEILDAHRYRDVRGTVASYSFDAKTATLVFHGGTLNGQAARYEQASNPPTKSQPPNVTFKASGDSCDRRL